MSKLGIVVLGIMLGLASVSFAQEPVETYSVGGMVDPYSGPTPPGMRFGDGGHFVSVQTGDTETPYGGCGCSMCRFGVPGAPCDPAWAGPCMDWKVRGWYSNWRDKDHGCPDGCGHSCRCRGSCY